MGRTLLGAVGEGREVLWRGCEGVTGRWWLLRVMNGTGGGNISLWEISYFKCV